MMNIPIAQPAAGDEEIAAVERVLRSGMFASGPEVAKFEKEFAAYCGVNHAVAVSNGTTALHAALASAGIGPGDEVIVPSFSFIATATCVSMCGARPVFADVDPRYFTIDPDSVNNLIRKTTKAVIGVHLFGQPFDIEPVTELCNDHSLILIEDAAQSHGSQYKGKMTGGFGKGGCFSFYPTKNMTTGEGGMITTDDPGYAATIRRFINHGQSEKYLHTSLGYNYRMTDIGAAIGRVQLGKLDQFNTRRNWNASLLDSHIRKPGLVLPERRDGGTHVFHQYVVRVTGDFCMNRQQLMEILKEKGIGTAVHYPIPIHRQPVYGPVAKGVTCPVSDALSKEVMSLPVHPLVTDDQLDYIGKVIREVE
jgi:perosamine synthetase